MKTDLTAAIDTGSYSNGRYSILSSVLSLVLNLESIR